MPCTETASSSLHYCLAPLRVARVWQVVAGGHSFTESSCKDSRALARSSRFLSLSPSLLPSLLPSLPPKTFLHHCMPLPCILCVPSSPGMADAVMERILAPSVWSTLQTSLAHRVMWLWLWLWRWVVAGLWIRIDAAHLIAERRLRKMIWLVSKVVWRRAPPVNRPLLRMESSAGAWRARK